MRAGTPAHARGRHGRLRALRQVVGGLLAVGLACAAVPVPAGAAAVPAAAPGAPDRCAGAQLEQGGASGDPESLVPVVFVHGISGRADNWKQKITSGINPNVRGNGKSLVEQVNGIPGAASYTFDYHDNSLRWIDRPEISERFAGVVDCLYAAFGKPVVVVAHSMGGLVARWVANSTTDSGKPRAERIGLAVTLGTPYEGSDVLQLARAVIDGGSPLSAFNADPRLPMMRAYLRACGAAATRRVGDCQLTIPVAGTRVPFIDVVYSEAGDALAAGSDELRALAPWPDSVDVHALAGSVAFGVRGDGLYYAGTDEVAEVEWGDMQVATDSATADGDTERVFTCRHTVAGEDHWNGVVSRGLNWINPFADIALVEGRGQMDLPLMSPWESPCAHGKLQTTVEVSNEVVGTVRDWIAGQGLVPFGGESGAGQVTAATAATQGPATMVVVDTSGSMGEDDGSGVIKIDAARRDLLDYLGQVAPDTTIGLRTYPDAAGDDGCNSGRRELDLARRDPAEMAAFVRGLSADGDTPTAEALRAAADDLDRAGISGATMVLLSDGESTCEDPCAAAAEIRQQGTDVTIISVGFQLSDAGREELECIAEETGGAYIDAADADDLAAVMRDLTAPRLELTVDHPDSVVADVGTAGSVEIQATVTNPSNLAARAVSARLRVDEGASPGLVAPDRPLGSLGPGGAATATWSFRPAVSAAGSTFRFTVLARSTDAVDVETSGAIAITDGTTRASAGPLFAEADRVAIMGDSFSAGEGTSDYISGTDKPAAPTNTCHRSRRTYLVEALDIPDELILACSGATTAHVQGRNWGNNEPSQVAKLHDQQDEGGPVDVVVLTVGGNNASFRTFVEACLWPGRAPCDEWVDGRPASTWVADRLEFQNLAGPMISAYVAINAELNAPDRVETRGRVAPIVVLAYPDVLPEGRSSCFQVPRLSENEMAFADDEFMAAVNDEVEGAVETAQAMGVPVEFVAETEGVMQPDHTVCDGGEAYVRPPGDLIIGTSFKELFHPNVNGYKAMTRGILSWSNTDAAERWADPAPPEPLRIPDGLTVGDALSSSSGSAPLLQPSSGDPTSVPPGEAVELRVEGFAPGGLVELRVESEPIVVGESFADGSGVVTATVGVPHRLPAGRHDVVVTGYTADATVRSVHLPIDVAPSLSWYWFLRAAFALASLIALVAGCLLVRHSARHSAIGTPANYL